MDDVIGASIERLEQAIASRPGFGVTTATAVSTVGEGVRCITEDGQWRIDCDLAERIGGTGTAPSPSVLVRAALGSCMAMTYRLRAARRGIPVTSIRVTVQTESAIAGMLVRDSDEPAGFRTMSYHVEIDSTAHVDDVMALIDEGDALSPVLDTLTRACTVTRTVTVTTSPDPVVAA